MAILENLFVKETHLQKFCTFKLLNVQYFYYAPDEYNLCNKAIHTIILDNSRDHKELFIMDCYIHRHS